MSRKWIAPLVVALTLAFSLGVVGRLPERVPTHWGLDGEADGWMGPVGAAFALPALMVGIWGLLRLLPLADPRRAQYARFWPTYLLVVNLILLFMAAVHVLVLGSALGWPIDVTSGILVLVGLMLVVQGNYLPRIRSNWWMGVRTPWTLSSEKVWRETHRVGGRTLMAGGAAAIVAAFLPEPVRAWVALTGIFAGALAPAVYSYLLWRRETRG